MTAPSVRVLLYHAVAEDRDFPTPAGTNLPPEEFEEQMAYLAAAADPISLHASLGENRRTVRSPVAVTFDDGYGDNYRIAYPLLRKYSIPATFFLTVSRLGRDWDFPGGRYPGLGWEEASALSRDPLIELGSHGMTHSDLTRLSTVEAWDEIHSSRSILAGNLEEPIRYFSYPHGSFNGELIEQVRRAGYQAAFSVIDTAGDRYSLRRILISRRDTMFRFKLKLSPLYWPLRRLI